MFLIFGTIRIEAIMLIFNGGRINESFFLKKKKEEKKIKKKESNPL